MRFRRHGTYIDQVYLSFFSPPDEHKLSVVIDGPGLNVAILPNNGEFEWMRLAAMFEHVIASGIRPSAVLPFRLKLVQFLGIFCLYT